MSQIGHCLTPNRNCTSKFATFSISTLGFHFFPRPPSTTLVGLCRTFLYKQKTKDSRVDNATTARMYPSSTLHYPLTLCHSRNLDEERHRARCRAQEYVCIFFWRKIRDDWVPSFTEGKLVNHQKRGLNRKSGIVKHKLAIERGTGWNSRPILGSTGMYRRNRLNGYISWACVQTFTKTKGRTGEWRDRISEINGAGARCGWDVG